MINKNMSSDDLDLALSIRLGEFRARRERELQKELNKNTKLESLTHKQNHLLTYIYVLIICLALSIIGSILEIPSTSISLLAAGVILFELLVSVTLIFVFRMKYEITKRMLVRDHGEKTAGMIWEIRNTVRVRRQYNHYETYKMIIEADTYKEYFSMENQI